jgi:hypothetical protein
LHQRSGRRRGGALGEHLAQGVHDLPDALHLLYDLVGDADVEFVFEREDEIDAVERVDAELFERRGLGDSGRVDLLFLGDDPDDRLLEGRIGRVQVWRVRLGVSGIVIA